MRARRLVVGGLALALATTLAACGPPSAADAEPDPATDERLSTVERSGRPAYWLGRSYRGDDLDAVGRHRRRLRW